MLYNELMNKSEIVVSVISYYQEKIDSAENQIKSIRNKAAKSPGAMESWSDKSKDEFTQLADALSREIKPLKTSIDFFNKTDKLSATIKSGSLVVYSSVKRGSKEIVLVVPEIGGEFISSAGEDIFLLSAKAELGKNLLGHKTGDTISWKEDTLTIEEIK